MIAFKIYLNREKLCVASVGNDGVLSAIVDCVSRSAEDRLELAVGGLISAKQDHLKWSIKTFTWVMKSLSKLWRLESHKQYVMNAARKLGWEIRIPE
jgi:hypothetical protein